jgi:hypothetical protein
MVLPRGGIRGGVNNPTRELLNKHIWYARQPSDNTATPRMEGGRSDSAP